MQTTHTILASQAVDYQFTLIFRVLRDAGFKIQVLKDITLEDIAFGAAYINGDICHPSTLSGGQLINRAVNFKDELLSPSPHVAILVIQTSEHPRASLDPTTLRAALAKVKRTDIPVIPLQFLPDTSNPTNPLGLSAADQQRVIYASLLGGLIEGYVYRYRKSESKFGYCDRVARNLTAAICEVGFANMNEAKFFSAIKLIVSEFSKIYSRGSS